MGSKPPWQVRRVSNEPAPDYSTKRAVADYASGRKKTRDEVDYKAASDDSVKRCSECKFYKQPGEGESDCEKVIGIVQANAVCDLFALRKKDKPAEDNTPTVNVIVQITNTGA